MLSEPWNELPVGQNKSGDAEQKVNMT